MAFALTRRKRSRLAITVVPMVDLMTILLVFFMVTSTYLDLDRIPAVEQSDGGTGAAGPSPVVMFRLGADGVPLLRGRPLPGDAFGQAVAAELAAAPDAQFVLLPSADAPLQALVAVMDAATLAGAQRMKVIRLEARP
jgi:biopolymer transport protein ExbD